MKYAKNAATGGVIARLAAMIRGGKVDGLDEALPPALEMLEPRLFLSANPFAELADTDYVTNEGETPAVHMPLAAGAVTTFAADTADVEAPVITSVAPSVSQLLTFTNTYFTITATDNVKVTKYTLTINGVNVPVSASTGKNNNYQFTTPGAYDIVATAFDAAGNAGSYAFTVDVAACPDVKAPTVIITNLATGNSYNSNIPVKLTVNDADSAEYSWTAALVNNDTGARWTLAAGQGALQNAQVATIAVADFPEGAYTLIAEAVDTAGNRTVREITLRIDTTPPEARVDYTDRLEAEQTTWFTVSGEDASAIKTRTLKINNTTVKLDANGRGSYIFAAAGEYTLVATVTDAAGNVTTVTRNLVVTANTDLAAPTVTIHSPAGSSYYGKTPLDVRVSIGDVDSDDVTWTVRVRYASGSIWTVATGTGKVDNAVIASINAYNMGAGTYTLEVEAIDPAGNTTVAAHSFTATRVVPIVAMDTIEKDYNNLWVNGPKTISGSVSVEGVPSELIKWSLTAENKTTGEITVLASGTGPVNGDIGTFDLGSGYYAIYLTAEVAGNVAMTGQGVNADFAAPSMIDFIWKTDGEV